jgi:hypothetical protein
MTPTAVAVGRHLIAIQHQAHQSVLGMGLAFQQGCAAYEVIGLALERHAKADAGFKRVGLVGDSWPANTRPASMRSMSSASRPSGDRPKGVPATQMRDHTVCASCGWHQTS